MTWFRVGGPAEVLVPAAPTRTISPISSRPSRHDVPVTVIGVGSNLLVRDGGIPGRGHPPGRGFEIAVVLRRSARSPAPAALDVTVALTAAEAGVAGLEFLSGIPGTVGGALRMNAGAYGSEIKDVLQRAIALDGSGQPARPLTPAEPGSPTAIATVDPDDWIFVAARALQGSDLAIPPRSCARMDRDPGAREPRSRSARAPAARPSPILPATGLEADRPRRLPRASTRGGADDLG